jgi:ABC-type branched-subunit amino acid transport system substrate-binding protein
MGFNRRQLILGGVSAGAVVASPALWAQSKAARKIVVGQSVPLTGAADQIGLAYLNGAKIYFDAINAKNGAGGYKI